MRQVRSEDKKRSSQGRNSQDKNPQGKNPQGKNPQGKNPQGNNPQNKKTQDKNPQSKGEQSRSSRKSDCSYDKKCGGCSYQGMDYAYQLQRKKDMVTELLGEFCRVRPIIGMEVPYHYRHKVHAAFGYQRGKGVVAGVYKSGTHQIVDIEKCLIENEKADAIIRDIKDMLNSFKIKTYDEDTGYGLLRHVLIRCGYHTGEIMVVLVLSTPILPSKNNFVKALRDRHPEITTVVVNVNNKRTSMILGEKETVIYGKGYIEDVLCEKTFRISPASFYQVNPAQTELLYRKALEMAHLNGSERVIDAYCGTGTIGIIAAEQAKEVIGVEVNKDAIKDAKINAKCNNVKNISFYQEDAGKFMRQLMLSGDKADVVIMDPPRSGSSNEFLTSLAQLKPEKIIYISCNPETQARDLRYLVKNGYQAREVVPVDLFPFTEHVESVCLMSRAEK